MKKIPITIIFLICSIGVAQVQNQQLNRLSDLEFYVRTNNPTYSTAEGSRYLNDEFLPARINGIQKTQLLRFNVPDNVVEVMNSKNEIMALSFKKGYNIKIMDDLFKVYETHQYLDKDGKKQTTFFEKLYEEGNFKLYLKENIKFTPAKKAKSGYEPAKPATFIKVNDTFYTLGFNTESELLTALPLKRKKLIPLFGEHAQTMEKMIKSEKLNIKDKEDLTALFVAYFKLL